jgi:hypothetical protein
VSGCVYHGCSDGESCDHAAVLVGRAGTTVVAVQQPLVQPVGINGEDGVEGKEQVMNEYVDPASSHVE